MTKPKRSKLNKEQFGQKAAHAIPRPFSTIRIFQL